MSEYQFIHFQAVDGPLDDEQLELMRGQSTRADVTRWEFTNEYHFGDFRGNPLAMLRNGYDVHLHFANFSIRRLMFRLPAGLPCDRKTFNRFVADDGMTWHADEKGEGGILEICPMGDADRFDSYLPELELLLERIAPVREGLMSGDLRALYLAWLACCYDEDAMEPPVPAGLATLSEPLEALAEFYELGPDLVEAAAERSPALPAGTRPADALEKWTGRQTKDSLRSLVSRLMNDPGATRAEVLAQLREGQVMPAWPMAEPSRTMAEMLKVVRGKEQQRLQLQKKAREAERLKRLAEMAEQPDAVVTSVRRLVDERTGNSYKQAARKLAELREGLGPEKGPAYVQAIADKLHKENPKRYALTAALRGEGLLE